ncbi:unnamed protein product [Sphagnum troendelagicum]|uniref:Phospholipase D n=1 Tax=Sphagnum troendelagicum TaxID=128251 RepID=A0ABP0UGU1_9BRYO
MEEEDGAGPPVTLVSETPQKPLRTHAGGRGHPKTTPVAGVHVFPGSHVARGDKIMGRPQAPLLHGTLELWLYEAKNMPNMDLFSERCRRCFSCLSVCKPPFVKAKAKVKKHSHGHRPKGITSDPYAYVVLAGAKVASTRLIINNANPRWNEHFQIPVAHFTNEILIVIKDEDTVGAQQIGEVRIPAEEVLKKQVVEGWYDVLNTSGKLCHKGAKLHLKIILHPIDRDPLFMHGATAEGKHVYGVPNTYFPCRKGCRLTLYQDAHVFDGELPDVILENGEKFEHRRCWEEMCTAILEARYMVYIAGWSVYVKVRLIRDSSHPSHDGGDLTLGELLKRKAAEGVRVLVLAWDDKTSHSNPFFKTEGLMGVHDEDTKKFFKNSGVRCVLAPRYADNKLSWFQQQVVGTLYTHHEKMLIVDAPSLGDQRIVTSFVGGLDLCDGRWDTPTHSLFATLKTFHKNDFHNPTFSATVDAGGPREPWHDLHCKIEGPAAYDVLTHFEQRWRKDAQWHKNELIKINRIPRILSPSANAPPEGDPKLYVTNDNEPSTCHAQVFRSVDSGSVKGFPRNNTGVERRHLVRKKNISVDVSIQMAYVKAIRSAQHFIYIENQYFIGSSYNWPDYKNAGANHVIPMELALKVAAKIRDSQRFAVYVVIPMWPEGIPATAALQEILFFQMQTMKMMYGVIAAALRDVGLLGKRHPRDYLNFYCLGNCEPESPMEVEPTNPPDVNSKLGLVQRHRRFMIYVHSKGMIVDDEYIICGSANINQRSMDGSRDTEIATGGYQPHYTWAHKLAHPFGQIYGFRMSLWAEHLGLLEDLLRDPEMLECVLRVNEMAQANWEQYVAEEVTDMKGHLLPYPIKVNLNGCIESLPGYQTFPDMGGSILGSSQYNLPDGLTT